MQDRCFMYHLYCCDFGSLKCCKTAKGRQFLRVQNSHKQFMFSYLFSFSQTVVDNCFEGLINSKSLLVAALGPKGNRVTGAEVSFWVGLFISVQDRMDGWIHIAIDLVIFNCYLLNGWLVLSYIRHVDSVAFVAKQWKKVRRHHRLGTCSKLLTGIPLCTRGVVNFRGGSQSGLTPDPGFLGILIKNILNIPLFIMLFNTSWQQRGFPSVPLTAFVFASILLSHFL